VDDALALTPTSRNRLVLAESLVRQAPSLLALARLLIGDEAEARDLVQQTLEIGLRHLDELREPEKLGSWLKAIEAREALRTRRRLRRLVRLDRTVGEVQPVAGPDERSVVLRDALRRLPERIRAAVVLHHMAGLSIAETARAMSVSENTTKSELKTGLRRLRELLDE